ncbi:MAG: bifunctional demethylmenaquinone methyltransferase/2-methoxy-6-polyprenyl-1,4-benzoquinol methylase UbiE [Phycisphaerales bacterium]|nr:bifunctional demethylmenaquinone methyltransferase/2-methoxy-6-polyprenyl-1,4-benzoquinol methylase UbiE [Phycisphaerales bacterium]
MSTGEAGTKRAESVGEAGNAGAAWSRTDLASNPHAAGDKQERVRRMFAAIAGSYDVNNRVHSFGLDQRWRRFTVRKAAVQPTDHVLDVACGTGDLSRLFADSGAARVTGLDYTEEMLAVAREKRGQSVGGVARNIEYIRGDAQALPFVGASFDVVSIAFGIRNVQDPAKAVGEFYRVLKPGGRLVVLEFDRPRNGLIRWGNDVYTRRIMPLTATLISGDKSGAYKYLPKSVETFLDREQLGVVICAAGFKDVSQTPLTFGVCVCHRGVK